VESSQSPVKAKGPLFLIPTPLGEDDPGLVLPAGSLEALKPIRDFVVENEKTAWRVLGRLFSQAELDGMSLSVLSEHTQSADIPALLRPAHEGRPLGLMSEAGCPGIADPGAPLVRAAHRSGIIVRALVGPSSIILALMASGMNGQAFRFCGYLPRDRQERVKSLKTLEKRARDSGETQIFIETPYRNDHMLSDMAESLRPDTLICAATDMSLSTERVLSVEAAALKGLNSELGKRPTVFLIGLPG
jgi:16S rRNA (cytidine1402-2'-O)-methyltransferase